MINICPLEEFDLIGGCPLEVSISPCGIEQLHHVDVTVGGGSDICRGRYSSAGGNLLLYIFGNETQLSAWSADSFSVLERRNTTMNESNM